MNVQRTSADIRAVSVPSLLRVAAEQLPRLSPEDRAVLLPHVKRDLGDHPASPDHHSLGTVSQVNHD